MTGGQRRKSDSSVKAALIVAGATVAGAIITGIFQPNVLNRILGSHTPTTSPLLVDDFKSGTKFWPLGDTSNGYWQDHKAIVDGAYHWEVKAIKGVTARLPSNAPSAFDFDVLAGLRLIQGTRIVYGLYFRQSDDGGYYFLISDDGRYGFNVWYLKRGEIKQKIPWTSLSVIRPQGSNYLRIIVQGPAIRLFLNDRLVGDFSDTTLTGGELGLAAALSEGQSAVIEINSFKMTLAAK